MTDALGATLSLALGVAISPVPIIATILMLLSPTAGRTGTSFLLGWLVGITAAVSVFTALGALLPTDGDDRGDQPVAAVVQAVLGMALVALAVHQWRGRPGPDTEPELPAWMHGVTTLGTVKAFGLGALLAAANPKNLFLVIGAGVAFAQADLGTGSLVVAIVVWVLLAASTVLVPVVAALTMPRRVAGPLDSLRIWLAANNATVMCVLMLVLGVNLLGKALGQA